MTSASLTVTTSNTESAIPVQPLMTQAHPVLAHALKATSLQGSWVKRSVGNATATAEVFVRGIDAESWRELLQMQQAAWQRLSTLQMNWAREWESWMQYAEQIKGANTMSKLAEREGNIGAQLTQLLSNQAADWVGLQENIHVDYSYWINEKLKEKRRSPVEANAPR